MSNNQKSYELLLDIGNDALSLNDLEASETAFLEAVDLKPAPIEAWFGLFQIKQAQKHTQNKQLKLSIELLRLRQPIPNS